MNKIKGALFASACLIIAVPAMAQERPGVAPVDQKSTISETVGEIIVTATRRAEAASTIPMSIVATTQASIDKAGIRELLDLSRETPGLQLRQSNQGGVYIAIRGVSSAVGAATTGIYINDTPIQVRSLGTAGADSAAFPALFDLARVEVLRGPQGTLFGAGSEGGAVRFITPDPSLTTFSGVARSELAQTEHGSSSYEAGGAVGGPIENDKLGFRVSAYARHDGGWVNRMPFNNALPGQTNDNTRDTIVMNGALLYAPRDNITIKPSLIYQKVDGTGTPDTWSTLSNYSKHQFVSGESTNNYSHDSFVLPSLRADWVLGNYRIVSNTSYFDRTKNATTDYTGFTSGLISGGTVLYVPNNPNFYQILYETVRQRNFNQEIRMEYGGPDSKLKYTIGAYYQKQYDQSYAIEIGPQFDAAVLSLTGKTTLQKYGEALLPGNVSIITNPRANDEQIAGFIDAEYSFFPWLSLEAGVRVAKTMFTYNENDDGPINGGPVNISGSQNETPVTPRVVLNFKPDSKTILYVSAAKGFRTGGVSPNVPTNTCAADLAALGLTAAPKSYQSDSTWSYEIGGKTRQMNDRIRVSASAFQIDWTNIQQPVSLTCAFSFTTNLGAARSRGADTQIDVQPVRGLTLSASVAYTDAYYTQTVNGGLTAGGGRTTIVSQGDRLPVAPWSLTLSEEYHFTVSKFDAYLRSDYSYSSPFQFTPRAPSVSYNAFIYQNPQVRQANARLGTRWGLYDVSLFVNNLTDSADVLRRQIIRPTLPTSRDLTLRPRTAGLTLGYRF